MLALPLRCMRCTIIPPYIQDQLARSADPDDRQRAIDTLQIDASLRASRMQSSLLAAAARAAGEEAATEPREPGEVAVLHPIRRRVFDCQGQEAARGPLERGEGARPTGDPAVDEAYDGLGATWDFYAEVLARDSIDDRGLRLDAYVHYGVDYDNAFWDGRRMIFGDGDGVVFNRFTASLDVIGHELTHGVTQHEADLTYLDQSGALNESVSDVFGSLVKQYALGQTAGEADWLIGAELLMAGVNGVALRSMKAPGTAYDDSRLGRDPQPAHMDDFVVTTRDNGGVHINSGIPNRAFALVATALGGRAWERAGVIWYDTLRHPDLEVDASFRSFAEVSVAAAGERFGSGSTEASAVGEAWSAVGVLR